MNEVLRSAARYLQKNQDFTVTHHSEIKGGLTNRLYLLYSQDGRRLVVKWYYKDDQQRLQREFEALSFLRTKDFTDIPTPYYKNDNLGYALYSFAQGKTLPFRNEHTQEVTPNYLDQMITFMISLHAIKPGASNKHFLKAVNAHLGIDDYMDSLESNLRGVEKEVKLNELAPIREVITTIRSRVLALTRTFERKIVTSQLKSADLRLSPVDFGSHNILVHQGKSTFVDFEDFGWDDPMQLVAYATPALSSKNKNYLMNNYVAKSPLPEYVTRRLPITMQLRELHWISRLLLGLTPSVIKKRQFAIGDFNLENYLSTQYGRISYHIEQLS